MSFYSSLENNDMRFGLSSANNGMSSDLRQALRGYLQWLWNLFEYDIYNREGSTVMILIYGY